MLHAFLIGLLATSSLIIGGVIASRFSLSRRTIGIILGFGAGTLISAISYELIYEAVHTARGTLYPAYGFFAGAFTFFLSDKLIALYAAGDPRHNEISKDSNMLIPMVLAIILDGIPESIVLGLGIFEAGTVSMAMLIAIFISNLPEAIAGSSSMKSSGWSKQKIIMLWLSISLLCSVATVAGHSLFVTTSSDWLGFIMAFAGGAILMMLANSMIPEAYAHAGKLAGVFTVLGFFASVVMVVLEKS